MTFKNKIEILLHRKGYKKTEFADKLDITYRALANYLAGSRRPKKQVLEKIEKELGVTSDFLFDDNQNLVLDNIETFFYNASEKSTDIDKAMDLLTRSKELFSGDGLTGEDKQALFSVFTEIYFENRGNMGKSE
ncbi:MAG: helix-turn-helix transcriptional regulator [Ruminococcaceae bacterium]|nr:helix-turn-helix transcriptional regulator [Oscillospiraceae bacterium]